MSAQDVNLNLCHNFPYEWRIKDGYPAQGIDYHGTTVFTTFACGGGSSMGYKLAGFDVIAANDIDPKMKEVYIANHRPKQFYFCSVSELLQRDDLPKIDVLDGSPPCSVFSITGSREKAWQTEKKFREGQAEQVLDDLFFDFIDLAEKMRPKVVVAENVKGMLIGHAKWYTREVVRRFNSIGYTCQVFLLNGATMGLPQKRERVFFIANRLNKNITLDFTAEPIKFREVQDSKDKTENLTDLTNRYWDAAMPGKSVGKFQSNRKVDASKVVNTIVSGSAQYHHKYRRELNTLEYSRIGSWPLDYNFLDVKARYLIGMSVPPVMMAQVSNQVYKQLLK